MDFTYNRFGIVLSKKKNYSILISVDHNESTLAWIWWADVDKTFIQKRRLKKQGQSPTSNMKKEPFVCMVHRISDSFRILLTNKTFKFINAYQGWQHSPTWPSCALTVPQGGTLCVRVGVSESVSLKSGLNFGKIVQNIQNLLHKWSFPPSN